MSEAFELCDESSGGLHGFSQLIGFANDPLDREPVDAAADRLKGDAHAASCVSRLFVPERGVSVDPTAGVSAG